MYGRDVGQLLILVNVKRDGSILLLVKVEVNTGSVFLEVAYRFIVGYGAEVRKSINSLHVEQVSFVELEKGAGSNESADDSVTTRLLAGKLSLHQPPGSTRAISCNNRHASRTGKSTVLKSPRMGGAKACEASVSSTASR